MSVILKPCCRYSLWDCLIPSSLLFMFRFLITIYVANIMCQYMVSRKTMPLMCMGSHHRVNLLYLSNIPLGKFGTMIVSTCWILWRTILTCKYGTLGPYMSSAIPTYSYKIGRLCRMLLSTEYRINFTGWLLMLCNWLSRSYIFT